jgi:hypothetical protein
MFEKLPHPRILIDSPVNSSPWSQLRIRITPRIFEEIRNCSKRSFWNQENLFEEKTGDEKSRDNVPLK